jgi:hypothetical protein
MDRLFGCPRLEKFVDVWKFTNSWTKVRFVGPVTSYYEFWFQIRSSTGRIISIQKLCLDWNPEPGEMDGKLSVPQSRIEWAANLRLERYYQA